VLKFYSLIFWLPTIAAIILLRVSWSLNLLAGRSAILFCTWFLLALVAQAFASSPAMWAVGLVLQVALGVTLSLRLKLNA